MIDRAVSACEENYDKILNKHLVKIMIDNVKRLYPGTVEGLIPEKITYLQVERYLQKIIKQGGSIRDMLHIIEELEESML
jgi:flagellar biosynthesis component FlhA